MSETNRLPIEESPGFETECYHNFRLSIVLGHPQLLPWFHSHFFNLSVKGVGWEDFPTVTFEEHLNVYEGVLVEEPLPITVDVLAAIRAAIDRKEYVLIYLNWKNIEQSHFFMQRDLVHEALIFGYDEQNKMFDLLAFEAGQKTYGHIRLPYGVCEAELRNLIGAEKTSQQWYAFYGFPLTSIRVKECQMQLLDTKQWYFALDRGRIRGIVEKADVYALGYSVNQYFSQYFRELSDGRPIPEHEYSKWNIMVLKMILHKKLMVRRLRLLEAQEGSSALLTKIMNSFDRSRQAMLRIRGLSYQFQRTQEKSLFVEIGEQFRTAYEQEKRAVPMLMEELVLRKLNKIG